MKAPSTTPPSGVIPLVVSVWVSFLMWAVHLFSTYPRGMVLLIFTLVLFKTFFGEIPRVKKVFDRTEEKVKRFLERCNS